MNITLEADYALRIVYSLTVENVKTDASSLSEKIGVTLRFTLKILRKLLLAGIVKSFKGTHGGYMLNADPSEITMYDVISAIDGPLPVNRCTQEEYECMNPSLKNGLPCSMHLVFMNISQELKKMLSVDFKTLAERRGDCNA